MCQIHQFPVYTLWQRNCIFTAWINASRADGVTLSYYEIVIFRQNFTLLIILWIEEFWARNNAIHDDEFMRHPLEIPTPTKHSTYCINHNEYVVRQS